MWKDGTNDKYGTRFLMVIDKESDKLGQNRSVGKVYLLHTDREWVPYFPSLIS